MKKKTSALLFFIIFSSFLGFAQDFHPISFKQEPLGNVLLFLAKTYQLNLIFPDSLVTGKIISGTYSGLNPIEIFYDISKKYPVNFVFESDNSVQVTGTGSKKNGRFLASVTDSITNEPIPDCFLYSEDSKFITQTDIAGQISLNAVPCGIYKIAIFRLGYKPKRAFVCFNPETNKSTHFFLSPTEIYTEEILVVNPVNQLNIENPGDIEVRFLETSNTFYHDIFRSVQSVSGVDGNEISANFSVRGGHPDENKILLNNLELLSPFHFSNFFNLTSSINQDILDTHYLYKDGFSAKYGNRMSGVFNLTTQSSPSRWKLSSDMNGTTATGGVAVKDVSSLFSYRTGNFRTLYHNSFGNQNIIPVYTDFFGTVKISLVKEHRLEFNFLAGNDKVTLDRKGNKWVPSLASRNSNYSFWINHIWLVNSSLFIKTTSSIQKALRKSSFDFINSRSNKNTDTYEIGVTGLSQEVTFEPGNGHLAQIGFEIQRGLVNYRFYEIRYGSGITNLDSLDFNLNKNLFQATIWSQYSFLPVKSLLISAGIRTDYREGINQFTFDPRLSILWKATDPVFLKWSLGQYSQFQPWDRVDVGSGNPVFHQPEKSIQIHSTLISSPVKNLAVEAGLYYKKYFQLFDDQTFNFEDRILIFNPINDGFRPDKGISKGFDFMVKQTEPFHYWVFSSGIGKSTLSDGKISVPRIFFNTWKIEFAFGIKTNSNLTFDLQWKNQSGVPFTAQSNPILYEDSDISAFFVEYGRRNGKLSAGNQFLKLKTGKTFDTKYVTIHVYCGFFNLFDRKEFIEEHTVFRQNRTIQIPYNKKVEIPRVFFSGMSFEGF